MDGNPSDGKARQVDTSAGMWSADVRLPTDAVASRAVGASHDERTSRRPEGTARLDPRRKEPIVRPTWSPDGLRIAFDSDRGADANVWTMTPAGASLRKLTGDRGASTTPEYSPDGATIVFVSDRSGSRQVWSMEADGDHPRRVTAGGGRPWHPSWSPTGNRLAFASTRSGHGQIWVIRSNVVGAKNLSKSERVDSTPSWS